MTTISTQNKIFLDPKVAFLIQECLNLWEVYVVRNTCSTWRKTSLKFNPPEEIYNQIVQSKTLLPLPKTTDYISHLFLITKFSNSDNYLDPFYIPLDQIKNNFKSAVDLARNIHSPSISEERVLLDDIWNNFKTENKQLIQDLAQKTKQMHPYEKAYLTLLKSNPGPGVTTQFIELSQVISKEFFALSLPYCKVKKISVNGNYCPNLSYVEYILQMNRSITEIDFSGVSCKYIQVFINSLPNLKKITLNPYSNSRDPIVIPKHLEAIGLQQNLSSFGSRMNVPIQFKNLENLKFFDLFGIIKKDTCEIFNESSRLEELNVLVSDLRLSISEKEFYDSMRKSKSLKRLKLTLNTQKMYDLGEKIFTPLQNYYEAKKFFDAIPSSVEEIQIYFTSSLFVNNMKNPLIEFLKNRKNMKLKIILSVTGKSSFGGFSFSYGSNGSTSGDKAVEKIISDFLTSILNQDIHLKSFDVDIENTPFTKLFENIDQNSKIQIDSLSLKFHHSFSIDFTNLFKFIKTKEIVFVQTSDSFSKSSQQMQSIIKFLLASKKNEYLENIIFDPSYSSYTFLPIFYNSRIKVCGEKITKENVNYQKTSGEFERNFTSFSQEF